MRKLLIPLLLLAFVLTACGASLPPNVQITQGKYQNGVYTPPMSNFTCDFGESFGSDSPFAPKLLDGRDGDLFGAVFVQDELGRKATIDYYRLTALAPERQALFADPANRRQALDEFLNATLIGALQLSAPQTSLLASEFVEDNLLFAAFYQPQGSYLLNTNTNTQFDATTAYYIQADGEWLYLVSQQNTDILLFGEPSDLDALRKTLDEFYSQCTFGN
jgi:hypothetical protein